MDWKREEGGGQGVERRDKGLKAFFPVWAAAILNVVVVVWFSSPLSDLQRHLLRTFELWIACLLALTDLQQYSRDRIHATIFFTDAELILVEARIHMRREEKEKNSFWKC